MMRSTCNSSNEIFESLIKQRITAREKLYIKRLYINKKSHRNSGTIVRMIERSTTLKLESQLNEPFHPCSLS